LFVTKKIPLKAPPLLGFTKTKGDKKRVKGDKKRVKGDKKRVLPKLSTGAKRVKGDNLKCCHL
jgi:hypothetical protein